MPLKILNFSCFGHHVEYWLKIKNVVYHKNLATILNFGGKMKMLTFLKTQSHANFVLVEY